METTHILFFNVDISSWILYDLSFYQFTNIPYNLSQANVNISSSYILLHDNNLRYGFNYKLVHWEKNDYSFYEESKIVLSKNQPQNSETLMGTNITNIDVKKRNSFFIFPKTKNDYKIISKLYSNYSNSRYMYFIDDNGSILFKMPLLGFIHPMGLDTHCMVLNIWYSFLYK